MKKLPVIVGFGGINPAGRSSFHHSYRRMVHNVLPEKAIAPVFTGLAKLMNLSETISRQVILDGTLIRKIDKTCFDVEKIAVHKAITLEAKNEGIHFRMSQNQHPKNLPSHWKITPIKNGKGYNVSINEPLTLMLPSVRLSEVSSGGQLPTGFTPSPLYTSKNQPKGLQLTVCGASDAIQSIGIKWDVILNHITPDEVSVYAGSGLGQLDDFGGRGLSQADLKGKRVTSKQMPLMLSQMPADFINSYIINSVGATGTNMGACATFLYNLRQGINDIQSGNARIIIVGGAECTLEPEIIEGFKAMGALAEDHQIAKLDASSIPNHRRASRPFSENVGFTLGESCQFFVLMDDQLALELGATIYASVADVFVNADANKKSISSPGIGNYITVAKAMALAKHLLGEEGVKKTFAQAHGTSTPQNRTSESHILNTIAQTFSIDHWNITAIKSYVGHSLGPAAGDQLTATLGVWEYGFIPGITTIDSVADDVFTSNLHFCVDHTFVGDKGCEMDAAFINSKGFGGNNATALILSPHKTYSMLEKKYGLSIMQSYKNKNKKVQLAAKAYDEKVIQDGFQIIYDFGTNVMHYDDLEITQTQITLSKFKTKITLNPNNPYSDYL
jgi:acetoacetyl-[acyl-carrier protein] synthase